MLSGAEPTEFELFVIVAVQRLEMICIPEYNELIKSSVTKESQQRQGAQSSACSATPFPYGHVNLCLRSQWGPVRDLLLQRSSMRMGMS